MSDMQVQAVMRFRIKECESVDEAHKIAVQLFDTAADEADWDKGVCEWFRFDPKKHDGFTAHCPNKVLYIDYVLNLDGDQCGFDMNVSREDIQDVIDMFRDKFGKNYGTLFDDLEGSIPYKIKVLYYYNGGCAGIAEVE